MLTSRDPDYRQKLGQIQEILSKLQSDQGFFSIDEFGPFAVKVYGGRRLVGPGECPTYPQVQQSKGRLLFIAALELSRNQVTHFYIEKKNTAAVIDLLQVLLNTHQSLRTIYLSWDAASWHMSRDLIARVWQVNEAEYRREHGTPHVELVPLPSGAQFLNVIESVFSGMARAIIHNSDYESTQAAKAAIDRYFVERNDHFNKFPKPAGNKIWGRERVECAFTDSHNCKDPRG